MRGKAILIAGFMILLPTAAWLAYVNRGAIREAVNEVARPQLPPARPYVESSGGATGPDAVSTPDVLANRLRPTGGPGTAPPVTPPAATGPASVEASADRPATPLLPSLGLPAEVNLAVPFTSQAPEGIWSPPYNEACEEASLVMAAAYFSGEASLAPAEADRRLTDLVEWENRTFGYYEDTTAAEVARMARDYSGLQAKVKTVTSADDIRAELATGKLVLLPAAGRELQNPYFRSPGPIYHMLLAKGFLSDGHIITNDPGTRRGADYLYDPDILLAAVHDWNGGAVEQGPKVMIVVWK